MPITRRRFLVALLAALPACRSAHRSTTGATAPGSPSTAGTSAAGATTPSTAGATAVSTTQARAATTTPPTTVPAPPSAGYASDPFTLGVASGDPLPDGVVLWTRLVGVPASAPSAGAQVLWELSSDESFATLAGSGLAPVPAGSGAVHVIASDLTPDTWYWYRFRVDGFTSRVGRTRTFPAAGTNPERLRFAVASCQDWQDGQYAAYRDLAATEGLDAVVFLGDYIYEYGPQPGAVRPIDGGDCTTYEQYAARYAQYRSDPDLQAAHARCPWLVVWDDHEVENNYANDVSENAAVTPEEFRTRRAAAYQAWWDHMPTRVAPPDGPNEKIYRGLRYGDLAELFLLDGRQYRSNQPCGDADQGINFEPPCAEYGDATRTMLGSEQEAWLLAGLGASTARWNVIGNQTVLADARLNGVVLNYDQWDGYPAARDRLLQGIVRTGKTNVVVVTGDIHLAAVADLTVASPSGTPAVVATELVGTSISSSALLPTSVESLIDRFPALHYLNAAKRGWMLNEVTADRWTATFRVVADVADPASAVGTDATFTVQPGAPGATRV